MSHKGPNRSTPGAQAHVFAALGSRTRLHLIAQLSGGEPVSIARLTHGSRLTRQAVTKHLRALERARLVRSTHIGRERLFALNPEPIEDAKAYLDRISASWDSALERLKAFVED